MISKEIITTPKGFLSWPALMEPAFKFQSTTEKEYRCDILFKLDADFTEMDVAIDKVATRAFGKNWKQEAEFISDKSGKQRLNPKYVQLPYKEQSERIRKDKESGEEKLDAQGNPLLQQGHVAGAKFIHVKNSEKFAPKIEKLVATGVTVPLTDPTELYAGCVVAACVSVFDWSFGGKQGVSLRLLGICKAGKGQPFGESSHVETDYKAVEMEDEESDDDDPMGE